MAEIRLLDAVLELEHPEEHDIARTSGEKNQTTDDTDEGEKEEGEKDEAGATKAAAAAAPPPPTRPKPVVFDIGGRRFRVDTLSRVAAALVVACTGTGTGADRLPITRRELLVRIAMRMWSPYAEAILQEVDDRSSDDRIGMFVGGW